MVRLVLMSAFQESLDLSPEDERRHFFVQDDTHFSHAITPLFASLLIPAMCDGTREAFANLRFPVAQFLARVKDGYFYQASVPFAGDMQERMREHQALVDRDIDTLMDRFAAIVEGTLLPAYAEMRRRASRPARRESALEDLDWVALLYTKIMQIHFELVIPRMAIARALIDAYARLTGRNDPGVVYALMSGLPSQSLATDRELWRIGRIVRESAWLTKLFAKTPLADIVPALQADPDGERLRRALDAFLEVHGLRCSHSHEVSEPTWQEEPSYALAMIRAYALSDRDFDAEFATTVARRDEALAALRSEPGLDPGALAEFLALRERAARVWPIDENHHFYIDAMLPASARGLLLHVADFLVAEGQIAARDDLFYLYLDEVRDLLGTPGLALPERIAERRAAHARQMRQKPKPSYGTPPAGADADPLIGHVFGTLPEPMDADRRILHGAAASAGVYTGTVRIVAGHDQFSEVHAGEVLVCRTTTPTWTVLFPLVGAIVTDAGGILSHAATVAREYRVPCVVGTKIGTEVLKDGDRVTVDGYRGTVAVEPRG